MSDKETAPWIKKVAAEILVGKDRCPICRWTLAETASKGCVIGNCSFRPEHCEADVNATRRRRAEWEKVCQIIRAAIPQVTPTPEEVRGILLSWTEEELANFWKLSSEPQPAPTEHLIRAMATQSAQSARECFLEMDAFLKQHPNPALQEKVDKLLSKFPAASVMCIKAPVEGTSEQASPTPEK